MTFTAPGGGASGTFANGTVTTNVTTDVTGVATSTVLTANGTTGTYNVGAASSGLTGVNLSENNVTAATKVVVTGGGGQSAVVGTGYGTLISATVEDVSGNPVLVAGRTVTFTVPVGGAGGTFLNGTNTTNATTNGSGVATATPYTANTTAGSATVTASSVTLTSAGTVETNLAGAASQDVVTGGGGQAAVTGAVFGTPLVATIEDADGNPILVGGTTVTFTAPGNGASGTFANGTATTNALTSAGGVATSSNFTAGAVGGTYAVTATSAGSVSASFTETNESVAGAPTGLSATLGNTTVALAWSAPSTNGGSAVTSYNVYEGTSSGGESAAPVTAANLTGCSSGAGTSFCTVTGLTDGTTYYFNVRAVNALGISVASNGASAMPGTAGGYDLMAADGGVFLGRTGRVLRVGRRAVG